MKTVTFDLSRHYWYDKVDNSDNKSANDIRKKLVWNHLRKETSRKFEPLREWMVSADILDPEWTTIIFRESVFRPGHSIYTGDVSIEVKVFEHYKTYTALETNDLDYEYIVRPQVTIGFKNDEDFMLFNLMFPNFANDIAELRE